jgi:Na+/melibiose symporter-like transporter
MTPTAARRINVAVWATWCVLLAALLVFAVLLLILVAGDEDSDGHGEAYVRSASVLLLVVTPGPLLVAIGGVRASRRGDRVAYLGNIVVGGLIGGIGFLVVMSSIVRSNSSAFRNGLLTMLVGAAPLVAGIIGLRSGSASPIAALPHTSRPPDNIQGDE